MNEEMAPWVLIEGPAPGSAEFLGRWLLAAADADREYAGIGLIKNAVPTNETGRL
jgi:hypothetical protein